MPLGPYIRCAVHESRSMPIASTFTGIFPTACVASVWKRMPLALQSLPMAAMSWIVPISLLANITETSTASWLRALSTAASASHPKGWFRLAGWPYFWVKYGSIASTTRGSAGVVDCASMKIGNVTAIARLSLRSSISGHFTARLATGGAQPARAARVARFALLGPFHRSPRSDRACGNSPPAPPPLPNRGQLGHVIGHQLGQAHRVQHLADRDLDLLHRPSQVAASHLRTVTVALHTLHDVDRALERAHHLPDRDLRRSPGQRIPALRPVVADDQPLSRQPLEDLGQELRWNPELVRDPLCAHRAAVLMDGDVMDGHQSVVGSFGEPQHHRSPIKGDRFDRRPFQSEFTPRHRDVKENPAGTGES